MHELSLCSSIRGIVERAAAGRSVATVHLQVGQFRQVIPDTLVYCWSLVAEGTPLQGSRLDIESIPITLSCNACGESSTVRHNLVLACTSCSSANVTLTTGEEFLITSLDLVPVASTVSPDGTKETLIDDGPISPPR